MLYCGFDLMVDSLYFGYLVLVLIFKCFQEVGYKLIVLVGGVIGMIGDLSFKVIECKLNMFDVIVIWVDKICGQVMFFFNFEGINVVIMVNNYDWFGGMGVFEFLCDIGKYFLVNIMIKKELVQQCLICEDQGIFYIEFFYSLFQGYDFVELNKCYGCQLQIGGFDQWGNIVVGIDLMCWFNQ